MTTFATFSKRLSAALILALAAPAARANPAAVSAQGAGKPSEAAPSGAGPASTRAKLSVPLFSERFAGVPIAVVEDEVVTIEDLAGALAAAHEGRGDGQGGKRDIAPVVQRLIDSRLLVMEARDMGLDALPEVKKQVDDFKGMAARELMKRRIVRDVRSDALEIEADYKTAVREWKLRSVLFEKVEDAEAFKAELDGGKPFEDAAKAAVAAKKGQGGEAGDFTRPEKLQPPVAAAAAAADVGKASTPVKVQGGWVVFRVDEIRYRDDPEKKLEITERSLARRQNQALEAHYAALARSEAKQNRALLKQLDFEVTPAKYRKLVVDKRVLATVKGGPPITVADLANELGAKYFHGIDKPIREKVLNKDKEPVFEALLHKTVLDREAARERIPESDDYKRALAQFEASILFGAFVDRAVKPDVKVSEEEAQQYYADNQKNEFTSPGYYKLDALAFNSSKEAQAALDKLNKGTDFRWLKANAEKQIPADKRTVQVDGSVVMTSTLEADVAKLLAGAQAGDFRLYSTKDRQYYVLAIVDVTEPVTKDYLEVRDLIGKKLFAKKMNDAIDTWARKLRDAHEVTVYLDGIGD